jgi:superfamily I DNA/RNA helicase
VKKFEDKDSNLMIGTAHTNKGNEMDMVFIDESLNKSTRKAITKLYENGLHDDDIETEFFLYYVACTRAKKYLLNATLLDDESFNGSQKFKIVSDSMESFLEYAKKHKKENKEYDTRRTRDKDEFIKGLDL